MKQSFCSNSVDSPSGSTSDQGMIQEVTYQFTDFWAPWGIFQTLFVNVSVIEGDGCEVTLTMFYAGQPDDCGWYLEHQEQQGNVMVFYFKSAQNGSHFEFHPGDDNYDLHVVTKVQGSQVDAKVIHLVVQ